MVIQRDRYLQKLMCYDGLILFCVQVELFKFLAVSRPEADSMWGNKAIRNSIVVERKESCPYQKGWL